MITTVAGGGPNNAPATSAALSKPTGLRFDSAGNLYIFDVGWQRLYKVTPGGTLAVVAGLGIIPFNDTLGDGGLATAANLQGASGAGVFQGITIDAIGNVFIADTGNFRIRRVDALTGIITTVAGNGTRSSSGNSGLANAAGLFDPTDVAVDRAGNLFIIDNGLVRRVDAVTQIITAYAGGSAVCGTATDAVGDSCPATQASLSATSLAVDTNGDIFIADASSFHGGDNRIRRVDVVTGIITTYAGTGVQGYTGDGGNATLADLNTPLSIAMDPANNLFILDSGNNLIRKVDTNQNISSVIALAAGSFSPAGLAVNSSDLLFFNGYMNASPTNPQVMQADPSTLGIAAVVGNGSQDFSGEGVLAVDAKLEEVNGVAVDGAGNIAIADTENFRIRYVNSLNGDISTVAGNGTPCSSANCVTEGAIATSVSLHTPVAVIFSTAGTCGTCLIFTDGTYIRQLTGNVITTYFHDSRFVQPSGLAMDGSQNLYIADEGANVVWKIASGVATVFAGGGLCATATNSVGDGCPANAAQLNTPFGIGLDNGYNVYIAEQGGSRIRRVNVGNGIISTVAGNGVCGYTGDGGPATSAQVCGPDGVAIDNGGDIFIADTGNSVIREVNFATGVISTIANGGANIDFTGDGGPALCAALNFPVGLAIDPGQNSLWFADDFNNRIRRVPFSLSTQTACVTLAASRDSSVIGQPVTFTATIAKSLSGNPSGTVTFSDGGSPLNTASVSGGQAAFTTSSLSVGSHVITAAYSGDGTFSSSTSTPITQVVLSNTPSTATATDFSVTAPPKATSGTALNVTVTALNGSNNVVTGYSGTVHFASSDGQAVLPADYTFTSSDSGAHVFSVTLQTPGAQTISATDTANASITGSSNSITVTAAAVTHFTVSAPASAMPVTALNFTVTALDSSNNPVSTYTGTVNFTSSDGQAVLPSSYTFTAADSGTHQFSATLKTAGNQTITVTDASNSTVNGTSSAINVLGPVQINVSESIRVSDVSATLPSAMIMVPESITVTDVPTVLPALQINVMESISVTDVPTVQPQGVSTTTSITPPAGGVTYGTPANVTVSVNATNGGGPATGNVTLRVDGGAAISMPLSNGSAVFNLGVLTAGSHSLSANFAAQGNFLGSSETIPFNVAQAPLTITANNASRSYGQPNPPLNNVTDTGFVNGDGAGSLSGTLSCITPATQSSPVGTYPITCSGLSSPNYAITFVPGTLTVTPAVVSITANNLTKILDAANPTLTWTTSGLANGDTASVLTTNPTCTTTATTASPVGIYPITCSGAAAANYTFAYVAGTLRIQYATGIGHVIVSPINADGSSVFKQGQTVPAKFAVYDANGVSIGTPGAVSSFFLTAIVSGTTTTTVESVVDTNNPDTAFRWDPTSQQWIFNISTGNQTAGNTYIYTIALNDGSTIMFQYGLR